MAIVEKGDGCSAGISKFWRKVIGTPPAWEGCCDKHDEAYNWGGTEADRKEADKALRDCMKRMGARHSCTTLLHSCTYLWPQSF